MFYFFVLKYRCCLGHIVECLDYSQAPERILEATWLGVQSYLIRFFGAVHPAVLSTLEAEIGSLLGYLGLSSSHITKLHSMV